ncbi:MAG: ATP-binding cassette domain-containing protein [Oscillospiraceae bacterium]|jgi:putative ABC transport system ATP-binding protein|nr:ATP-binding cassette domain-containing protein [Oscillospiraceae bacterium]
MIECIDLCKSFGEKELFHNLSFQIDSGEFFCFSGESGRGKTTLLNILGMIEPPTAGKVLFDGSEIRTNGERLNFFRTKVGFVFQNFALVEGKTVEQNLALVRKSNRQNISIQEALDNVGISEKVKSKVYTLSGGEQQRVALARLFIKKCDIILADEPTGSLDSHNAKIVIDILKTLNTQGKTVVLVTHDSNIKQVCDRVISL